MTWPKLNTDFGDHTLLVVQWGPDVAPARFCGDSWCTGRCGMPALVVRSGDVELKAHSCMVAHGPVMQQWRVRWVGEKVVAPEDHVPSLMRRIWL